MFMAVATSARLLGNAGPDEQQVEVLTAELRRLVATQRASNSSRKPGGDSSKGERRSLKLRRLKAMEAMVRENPRRASASLLSLAERELLLELDGEEGLTIEQPYSATTVARMSIRDVKGSQEAVVEYSLDTGGRVERAYADASVSTAGCGDVVELNGYRAGRSMLVTAMRVVGRSTEVGSCSPVGEQRIAVLLLKREDDRQTRPDSSEYWSAFFGTRPDSVKSRIEEFSGGRSTVIGDVFGYFSIPPSLFTCTGLGQVTAEAMQQASALHDLSSYQRFVFIAPLPASEVCGYTGVATVGCYSGAIEGVGSRPVSWVYLFHASSPALRSNVDMAMPAVHELGHNLGLGHARSRAYAHGPLGADETSGIVAEYGDVYSVMGSAAGMAPASPHLAMLGWLDGAEHWRSVESDTDVVLAAAGSSAVKLKAIRVRRRVGEDEWLWLEHREAMGVRNSGAPALRGGLLIHRETAATQAGTELLSFGPDMLDAELLAGSVWDDPFGPLSIEAGASGPDGIAVRIQYQEPCAHPQWPDLSAIPGDAHALSVWTESAGDCRWDSRANNYFVANLTGGPATGPAFARFGLAENTTGAARSGSVTVARQTAFFSQPPFEELPKIEMFSARTGSLSPSVPVRFATALSVTSGLASVGPIEVWFGEDPVHGGIGCGFQVNGELTTARLLNPDQSPSDGAVLLNSSGRLEDVSCSFSSFERVLLNETTVYMAFTFEQKAALASNPGAYVRASLRNGRTSGWIKTGSYSPQSDCVVTLNPPLVTLPSAGGEMRVELAAAEGCAWTVSGAPEWLGIAPTEGTGSTPLQVFAHANEGAALRSAAVQIGPSSFGFMQLGKEPVLAYPVSFLQQELVVPPVHGARVVELGSMVNPLSVIAGGSEAWLKVSVASPPALGSRIILEWDDWTGDTSRVAFAEINGSRLPVVQVPWTSGAQAAVLAGQGLVQDSGPGEGIPLREPSALAIGPDGHLYIGEKETSRIIQAQGDGVAGVWYGSHVWRTFHFTEGSGNVAQGDQSRLFNGIVGLVPGPSGSMYALEAAKSRVVRIGPDGSVVPILEPGTFVTPGGLVFTEASNVTSIAGGPNGLLFAASRDLCKVWVLEPGVSVRLYAGTGECGTSGDGEDAAQARIDKPVGLAADASGNLYITEPSSHRIRIVDAEGRISTFAGTGVSDSAPDGAAANASPVKEPSSVAIGPDGLMYFTEPSLGLVRFVTSTGSLGTVMRDGVPATFVSPSAVAAGDDGSIYVADSSSQTVTQFYRENWRLLAGVGSQAPLGDDGPAGLAWVARPTAVISDGAGGIIFADSVHNKIRRIDADGVITTIAGNGRRGAGGDGGRALNAEMNQPEGLALDTDGNLYFADTQNHRIRRVTPEGVIELVAGRDAGFSGDGGPALEAQFSQPKGIAFDAGGNLYVADSLNRRLRRISRSGGVTTVAGDGSVRGGDDGLPATQVSLYDVRAVAVDDQGRPWFTDASFRLSRIETDGTLRVTRFSTHQAGAFAFGGDGSAWLADPAKHNLLKLDLDTGRATIVAGTSQPGNGPAGFAKSYSFFQPTGIAVLEDGSVAVCDRGNDRIIRITEQ
jgi:sugar lactone lactonase YvrE